MDLNYVFDHQKVMESCNRRERVSRMHISCDRCGADQVQLVSWQHTVVTMKCRRCKEYWQFDTDDVGGSNGS